MFFILKKVQTKPECSDKVWTSNIIQNLIRVSPILQKRRKKRSKKESGLFLFTQRAHRRIGATTFVSVD